MKCCDDMGDMKGMMGGMGEMKEMMGEMGGMKEMMLEMMPKCFGMMLEKFPKESRQDFLLKIIPALIEKGCSEMTAEEKMDFMDKLFKKVTA